MSTERHKELRRQMRATSRENVILQEMKRLGFWEVNVEKPSISEEIINQETELNKELRSYLQKKRILDNKDALLKRIRKERMKASREKQKANRVAREEAKKERQKAWRQRQTLDITNLGEDVSFGLHKTKNNEAKLLEFGLPVFNTTEDLAKLLKVNVSQLRFLSFNRKVSKVSHYQRFYLPKKSGGKRLISAPMPFLKQVQYNVLHEILYKLEIQDTAYGFVPERSIVDNAKQHLNKAVVVNMDLKNFFPTISYRRVKGLFESLGYAEKYATILALLCTEPDTNKLKMDGQTYYVASGERHLPQGAPTSPVLTNLICRTLDKRLLGAAQKHKFTFTRYADDLTFSADDEAKTDLGKILWIVHKIVKEEGFVMHSEKLRIMHHGRQQEVTGIVVNEKLNVSRKHLKNFRALLFQIERDGFKEKTWNNTKNMRECIRGYSNFVYMVNPDKGRKLKERVQKILA